MLKNIWGFLNIGFADIDPELIITTSAKAGTGIGEVLSAVVDRVPPPAGSKLDALKLNCVLLDSTYDEYRGVICLIKVDEGTISTGDSISFVSTGKDYVIQEVGILLPHRLSTDTLRSGQVGYVITGMKALSEAKVGETIHRCGQPVQRSLAFQEPKSMVFASIYPVDGDTYGGLKTSVEKLLLTDASVSAVPESSSALGMGLAYSEVSLSEDAARATLSSESLARARQGLS